MDSGAIKDAATSTLRILLLEDRDEDAALIERQLNAAGLRYALRRVASEAGFRTELATGPDLVLSDYDLPGYDGIRALELAREIHPELPFILVSGRMNDEIRRRAVRLGVSDVLSKDRLGKLAPAIGAALKMREVRGRAHEAQPKLAGGGQEFRNAFEHAGAGMALTTLDGRWLKVNQAFCEITGYPDAELQSRDCHSITHPDDVPGDVELLKQLLSGEISITQREKRYLHKAGHAVWVQVTASLVRGNDGAPLYRVLQVLDITHRREAEERFRATFEQAAVGMAHLDLYHRIIRVNQRFCEIVGFSPHELVGKKPGIFNHPEDFGIGSPYRDELLSGAIEHYSQEKRYVRKCGAVIWVKRTESLARDDSGKPLYFIRVIEDITERKRTEARLERANRARRVLAECSRVQVHARTEQELLTGMSRTIVESGGYRQGWIGLTTGDADRPLEVAAHAGYCEDQPLVQLASRGKDGKQPGVALEAIASGQTVVVRDILGDPRPEFEWRRVRARRHRFQSSIALLLASESRPLGVLVMHAAEPDAFDDEEIGLLTTLANDVAYGICNFRAEVARRQAEARLARLARARRVMAESNRALIHATNEAELLEQMCRIAVESGGFKQAWVGLATGDATRPVYPAAYAGYAPGDAPMRSSVTWSADGRYQGAMGQVLASGEIQIARDILNDPRHAHRRGRALERGFQSSIMLPLVSDGNVLGAVALYAGEPDAFDDEELGLLRDMADDMAFGIATLRTRIARRNAEEALRASEERFRILTELSSDWSWEQDAELRFVAISRTVKSHAGLSAEDHIGKTRWELPNTCPVNTTWDEHQAVLRARQPFRDLLLKRIGHDGRVHYLAVSGDPVYGGHGQFQGYRGVAKNVTDRIGAEMALRESERRSRDIFNQAAVGITRVDLNGVLVEVNQKFCDMLGYTRDELIGKHIKDITYPEDFGHGARFRAQLVEGGVKSASGEKRFVRKDGGILWARRTMSVACDDAGNPQFVISIVENITERKELEQRFELTFNHAAVGMILSGLDGRYMLVNQRFADMVGYTREELVGRPLVSLAPPEEHEELAQARLRLMRGEVESVTSERRYVRKDGGVIWTNRTLSLARNVAGEPLHFISMVEDITERKRLERRYRETFEQAAVGITRVGLDGVLIDVNQKFCDMLGYTREGLVGRSLRDITHAEDYEQGSWFRAQLARGARRSAAGEKRFVRKDGTFMWARRTMSIAHDDAGNPQYVISVVEDISERKQTELELKRKTEIAHLLESLARAANEAASPEAAMRTCLERICAHGGWALGRLGIYGRGEGERFPERSLWQTQEPSRYEAFMRASLDAKYFAAGGRFISVVLKEKRPVWLADIAATPGFGRMGIGLECGLHSAFAFPVIVGGEVAAFLEFFATEPREPDVLLLDAVNSVGAQLARLIERGHAMAAAAQLAAIVESSQDAMVSAGPDSTILTWNAGAERLFGYSAAEAVGLNLRILVPEDRRHEIEPIKQGVLAGAQYGPTDTERLHKDGRRVQVSISVSPLRDTGNNVTGFALIYRDITDRKRAEEAIARERALLRTIIDTLPDYIYVKDRDGRFQLGNRAWLQARGMADEAVIGKTAFDIYPREIAEKMAAQDVRIVEGGPPLLDEEQMVAVKTADGRHGDARWSSTTKVPMKDSSGDIIGTIGISRDITEQRLSARRHSMEHAVTRVLAESATVDVAVPKLLRTIGEAMGWAYGARWGWSVEEQTLVRREYWSDVPVDFSGSDESVWLRLRTLKPGGLLRRAWVEKATTWIADIEQEQSLSRRRRALELGFRSAYSFPIFDGRDVIGVMEFFGRAVRQPDEMLLQITSAIGHQIGQFIRHRQAEEALRTSEATLRATFDQASVGIAITSPDLRFIQVNDRYSGLLGYTSSELVGKSVSLVQTSAGMEDSEEVRRRLVADRKTVAFREKQLVRKDGSLVWVAVATSMVRDDYGAPKHCLTVIQDISERKRAEAALHESEEQFRQLANNIPQVFWITDMSQRQTLYVSPAAADLVGKPVEDIKVNPRLLIRAIHTEDRARIYTARKAAVAGGYDETYRIVRPDGSVRWVHDRAFPVRDGAGRVYRIAGIAEDITERKLAEERLMHLAHYDVLTSLPNRVLFYDRLRQALAQAKRNQWITGVLFIDIDRFKNVNDTLGHAVGDKLLQQVSERLVTSVRSGDTVGRLGGDEFAIVLSNLSSPQDANMVAQKIMGSFNTAFRLDNAEIYVTASIGITLYPDDSTEQDTLIRNADAAMYRAKEIGRNCYQFYTPEMNARALQVLGMESSLRRALERNEFLLHYQPKANVGDGTIAGVEALIRWRHPERGMVAPGEFMPVMEETGLVVPVGEWVLRAVCNQIRAWERDGIGVVPVAVNLSARQFSAKDLGPTIKRILEEHQVDARRIEFEITESSLMTNTEEAVRTLEYLSNLGVRLSIDDFGTGYSSLGYLKRFPLDCLKIDRSFVRDITSDGDDATITRAVISMAHSLGLKVIAEGVETEEQLAFLAEYGCDQIQGYYFGRPLAAEECGNWLQENRRMRRPFHAADSGAPVVLLVDDDEDALTLLKRGLIKDGYQILLARDAAQALNLLGIHRVDVIITDQNMPGMAGTEFLQRVKSLHPGTIRMITSGYTDFQMMTDAVNKGEVTRFLPKTLTEEELRSDVRQALQSRNRVAPPVAA